MTCFACSLSKSHAPVVSVQLKCTEKCKLSLCPLYLTVHLLTTFFLASVESRLRELLRIRNHNLPSAVQSCFVIDLFEGKEDDIPPETFIYHESKVFIFSDIFST